MDLSFLDLLVSFARVRHCPVAPTTAPRRQVGTRTISTGRQWGELESVQATSRSLGRDRPRRAGRVKGGLTPVADAMPSRHP
jgi:hypothetical protein